MHIFFFLHGKNKIFTFLHTIQIFQWPRRTCEQMGRLGNKLWLIKVVIEWLPQVSVSWKKLPACSYFPSSTLRTTHALKVLLLDSYNNIMYYLTNLSYVLKLLNLCFIFSCLVGDKMNQKDKKSHNQDLSNLALGYCLPPFHKSCLLSWFHFSHL